MAVAAAHTASGPQGNAPSTEISRCCNQKPPDIAFQLRLVQERHKNTPRVWSHTSITECTCETCGASSKSATFDGCRLECEALLRSRQRTLHSAVRLAVPQTNKPHRPRAKTAVGDTGPPCGKCSSVECCVSGLTPSGVGASGVVAWPAAPGSVKIPWAPTGRRADAVETREGPMTRVTGVISTPYSLVDGGRTGTETVADTVPSRTNAMSSASPSCLARTAPRGSLCTTVA